MDTARHIIQDFAPPGGQQTSVSHDDAVNVEGLEDLFKWASDMVADGSDPKTRRVREQKISRNILEVIQKNKEYEAREKYAEEISYLQKRVIALLQILTEKLDETSNLKQVIVTQYYALSRIPQLEDEVKQLQAMTWYREEAEAERKHLMTALSKMKQERDFLDELVTINENENCRLAKLLSQSRAELAELQSRKWWHGISTLVRKITRSTTA